MRDDGIFDDALQLACMRTINRLDRISRPWVTKYEEYENATQYH